MMSTGMIKNYLLTALRVLSRDRINSLITLLGLGISLAVALVITLYVWDETHVDAGQPDADRVFRVEMLGTTPGRAVNRRVVSPPALIGLLDKQPNVEQSEFLYMQWSTLSRLDDPSMTFNYQIYSATPAFFDFFKVESLEGDAVAVLSDPTQVIVTETMRDRLFPNDTEVLGKAFAIDGMNTMQIGAVIPDFDDSTHLRFDMLTSIDSSHIRLRDQWPQSWSPVIHSYVKLIDPANTAVFENAMADWLDENLPPQNLTSGEYRSSELMAYRLRPLRDIHLQTTLDYTVHDDGSAMRPSGDPAAIRVMLAIALVILAIGCINYVNLSTARAMTRIREVAMRKVLGASRGQLISQFLGESALYVLVSLLIALGLVELSLDAVNDYSGKQLSLAALSQPGLAALCIGLVILTTLLAGMYPAFYLASIRPQEIWKQQGGQARFDLRKILVVIQFAASITLMICTWVFYSQTRYAQNLDLGYSTDDVLVIYGTRRGPQDTINLHDNLENAFKRDPSIISVSGASSQPSWDYYATGMAQRFDDSSSDKIEFGHLSIDIDYFDTFRIQPIAGRLFSDEFASDRLLWSLETPVNEEIPVVINESASRMLGFASAEAAIGEPAQFEFDSRSSRPVRIIGVVRDMHFKTVRSPIAPMLYHADPTQFNAINVRYDPERIDQALAHLDTAFREVLPFQAVSRDFVDEEVRSQYDDEVQRTRILATAAGLAIIVSILGLYGLAAFSAARRTREISIRKVMGATTSQIATMVLWQFSRSVLWANLFAWPLAWYLMSDWLSGFAYRVVLDGTPFFVTGMLAMLIASVTVAAHAIRVSRMSPSHALRYE